MIVDLWAGPPVGADDAETTTAPTPQDPLSGLSQEATAITAGLGGFLVLFALGLAVWFLGRDLTRRLRRMNRAEDERVAARGEQVRASSREDAAQPDPGSAEDRDPLA